MKVKAAIVLVLVLLIGAQLYFGHRDRERSRAETAAQAEAEAASSPAGPAAPGVSAADDVVRIAIAAAKGDPVVLERGADGWVVASYRGAPADGGRVERLLADVVQAAAAPQPVVPLAEDSGTAPGGPVTGLDADGGVGLAFTTRDNETATLTIGLRPTGVYDQVYGRIGDGEPALFAADLRGDVGLWHNHSDEIPGQEFWLDTTAMRFDPATAVRVEVTYPDHSLAFQRNENGDWQPDGYIPTDEWDRDGLAEWLRELATYTVVDLADADVAPVTDEAKAHRITVTLADGTVKTATALHLNKTSDCVTETSDRPGVAFRLADWRFRKYLHPLGRIFPNAAPRFRVEDIRFVDIRQGGESVKISLRDGEWRGVALPYRVRAEAASRLAWLLATLQPEDYASPDFKAIRAGYGGPMVEVILATGDVHQYRLAGRHPLFSWRYVTVDGRSIFSISDEEAGVMFPGFADILDLGKVFPTFDLDHLVAVELSNADDDLIRFAQVEDGTWTAESESGLVELGSAHGDKLMTELLDWSVAGFYDPTRLPENPELVYHLRLVDTNGAEKTVTFLPALDRDIPFLLDNGRSFVIDRSDFFNWLAEIREIRKHIETETARLEAERAEADRLEAERLENERLEAERAAAERGEAERVEAERLENEQAERERAEAEAIAAEAVEGEAASVPEADDEAAGDGLEATEPLSETAETAETAATAGAVGADDTHPIAEPGDESDSESETAAEVPEVVGEAATEREGLLPGETVDDLLESIEAEVAAEETGVTDAPSAEEGTASGSDEMTDSAVTALAEPDMDGPSDSVESAKTDDGVRDEAAAANDAVARPGDNAFTGEEPGRDEADETPLPAAPETMDEHVPDQSEAEDATRALEE
ncbi:MAG: DUF4340 domain-containing protein [Planctomycetes bacterium]|nr:DUF4340 domain-containing protein [Planctomycetota bacterium]